MFREILLQVKRPFGAFFELGLKNACPLGSFVEFLSEAQRPSRPFGEDCARLRQAAACDLQLLLGRVRPGSPYVTARHVRSRGKKLLRRAHATPRRLLANLLAGLVADHCHHVRWF